MTQDISDKTELIGSNLKKYFSSAILVEEDTNFDKLITVLTQELAQITLSLESIYFSKYINTAEGIHLNQIGDLVNCKRQDLETDSIYRQRIKLTVQAKSSGGTKQNILDLLNAASNTHPELNTFSFIEQPLLGPASPNAAFAIAIKKPVPIDALHLPTLTEYISIAKAAGVAFEGWHFIYKSPLKLDIPITYPSLIIPTSDTTIDEELGLIQHHNPELSIDHTLSAYIHPELQLEIETPSSNTKHYFKPTSDPIYTNTYHSGYIQISYSDTYTGTSLLYNESDYNHRGYSGSQNLQPIRLDITSDQYLKINLHTFRYIYFKYKYNYFGYNNIPFISFSSSETIPENIEDIVGSELVTRVATIPELRPTPSTCSQETTATETSLLTHSHSDTWIPHTNRYNVSGYNSEPYPKLGILVHATVSADCEVIII